MLYIISPWLFVKVISKFLWVFRLQPRLCKTKIVFSHNRSEQFSKQNAIFISSSFFSVFRSGSGSRWSNNFRRRSHPGFANYCQAWNYFDAWTNFTHEFFPPNCYVSNEESNQWIKNLWCCAFQVRWLDYRKFHT